MLPKKDILSVKVSAGRRQEFMDDIISLAKKRRSSYVCFANVHMLVSARIHPPFRKIVEQADIVAPDGKPIVKCFEWFYDLPQEKIDGMNFLPELLRACADNGLSVFFFGSTQGILDKTAIFLNEHYPQLTVAGMIAPPKWPFTPEMKMRWAGQIKDTGANVVIAVLGCPKQETWMAEMKGTIPAVMLGMGAALEVLIGSKKRAPEFLQKAYLECFYRMYQEPGRLIRRYVFTNSIFLWLLATGLFRKMLAHH